MTIRTLKTAAALCFGMAALATATRAAELNLGDAAPDKLHTGWGKPAANKSIDGKPLTVGGKTAVRGIGLHSEGWWAFKLDGKAGRFQCRVGIDDETGGKGRAELIVYGDNFRILARSGVVKGGEAPKTVTADLRGQSQVVLEFTDGGDGTGYDHLDLLEPVIAYSGKPPKPFEPAPESKPYILTPPAPAAPRINPPRVFGVRPGSPFLFRVPVGGERPVTVTASGLPAGLTLDPATGIITGTIADPAPKSYTVALTAKNAKGAAADTLRIVVGDRIALTPPMGWNSWYVYSEAVSESYFRAVAAQMAKSGLADYGWCYVNLDDCWQGERAGADKALQANEKFPDMKGAVAYIHSLGLKAGLYSVPMISSYAGFRGGSCANADGTYEGLAPEKRLQPGQIFGRWPGFEKFGANRVGPHWFFDADMRQVAEWGFDYIKVDWHPNDVPTTERVSRAVRAQKRDIVLSLSNAATFECAADYVRLAELWRTTGDIQDTWASVSGIGFGQGKWAPAAGPGHWNDPDMLQVGYTNTPNQNLTKSRPSRLTPDEQYSQVTLWCLLAAPLLVSCDLDKLDAFTLNLLTNPEVLAVDQDPLGKPAVEQPASGRLRIFRKELEDGSVVVGLFNTHPFLPVDRPALPESLRLPANGHLRDCWRMQDVKPIDSRLPATVPPHGCLLIRAFPPTDR